MNTPENNFELPKIDGARSSELLTPTLQQQHEANLARPELNQGFAKQQPTLDPAHAVSAAFGANQPQTVASSAAHPLAQVQNLPESAEDNDLIEMEWVNKAKAIVELTKHDPFKQSQEINKFKAGYIKKRYNKDINLTEG